VWAVDGTNLGQQVTTVSVVASLMFDEIHADTYPDGQTPGE